MIGMSQVVDYNNSLQKYNYKVTHRIIHDINPLVKEHSNSRKGVNKTHKNMREKFHDILLYCINCETS